MKLSANVICSGRYWKAFEDIPDELLSDAMRKYAVVDVQEQRRDSDDVESNVRTIHKQNTKLYVRRGYAFRLAEGEELISGEEFYRKRPRGGFEKMGSVVPLNA